VYVGRLTSLSSRDRFLRIQNFVKRRFQLCQSLSQYFRLFHVSHVTRGHNSVLNYILVMTLPRLCDSLVPRAFRFGNAYFRRILE